MSGAPAARCVCRATHKNLMTDTLLNAQSWSTKAPQKNLGRISAAHHLSVGVLLAALVVRAGHLHRHDSDVYRGAVVTLNALLPGLVARWLQEGEGRVEEFLLGGEAREP